MQIIFLVRKTRAAPRWPPQLPPPGRKLPPTLCPRVRPKKAAGAKATEGRTVARGWAHCLKVRASGRSASPALSERLRPAGAGTSPAAPRPESTRWPAASVGVAASAGAKSASTAASHNPGKTLLRPPPTAAASLVRFGPRAPDPAHAAPPRATPRLQENRRART